MKTNHLVVFILLTIFLFSFGLVTLKATPVDEFYEKIKGRWYLTRITGGIGGIDDPVIPLPGDSVIVRRIPDTDSIVWKTYHDCQAIEDFKYLAQFKYWPDYLETFYTLEDSNGVNVVFFNNDGFSIGWLEVRDQFFYWYSRIDTFQLHDPPVITRTQDGSRCGPGEVTLGAASNEGIVRWYAVPTGDSSIAEGTIFVTPALNKTTVFYAEAVDGGCVTPERKAVVAKIKERCAEIDSIAGKLTGKWYLTGTGDGLAQPSKIVPIAGDSLILSPIPDSDSISGIHYHHCLIDYSATYDIAYDSSFSGHEKTWMLINPDNEIDRVLFSVTDSSLILTVDSIIGRFLVFEHIDTFTLHPPPMITNTREDRNWRCGPGAVTLYAEANIGTIRWYAFSDADTAIATGTMFITSMLEASTLYYVDAISDGCVTPERSAITARIIDLPQITGIFNGSRCGPGEVTLSAIADPGSINWYTSPEGDTAVASGSIFTTHLLDSTTTFYAEASNQGCITPVRTEILATIVTGDTCQSVQIDPGSGETVRVYPNPASGKVYIMLPDLMEGEIFIELVDLQGTLIEKMYLRNSFFVSMDLSGYPEGLYIIRLSGVNRIRHMKVMKY